jgi:hypothetical protein
MAAVSVLKCSQLILMQIERFPSKAIVAETICVITATAMHANETLAADIILCNMRRLVAAVAFVLYV